MASTMLSDPVGNDLSHVSFEVTHNPNEQENSRWCLSLVTNRLVG